MAKTIKNISTLKRHLISALRVFLATFLGTIAIQLQAMPTVGTKEFLISMFISSVVTGFGSILKVIQEELLLSNDKS